MGVTTAGTFAQDAASIGMNGLDIQTMTETIRTLGEKGTAPYEYRSRKYAVKWEKDGHDIVLLSMKPL